MNLDSLNLDMNINNSYFKVYCIFLNLCTGCSLCYIVIYRDTTIKTQEGKTHDKDAGRTSLEKYSPLTLLQGFERVVEGLHVRGCWRLNINFIF